jgi:acyl-CoA synthetase (AMP-forming)/AMP-acid ligase II
VRPLEEGWIDTALRFGVDAISATPTFWRRSFLTIDDSRLAGLRLAQISLGGEPVAQDLLDRLRATYPSARLTHIYASSEAGACIVVSDGRAGFPKEWLGGPRPNGVEIRAEDGRLFVRSPWASLDSSEGWIDTGDRVRVLEDRVEIVGRSEGLVINVGGAKVAAAEVAEVILGHPDVAWCAVKPKKAPIVGQLPVAEVGLVAGSDLKEEELIVWCEQRLPDVAVPRVVTFTNQVPTSATLKGGN